ncbi:SDR family oxidoreductase [Streptomyces sp. NPDC060027]|uniref:SDR family oxidoreductase n=1 Tax=Streptomyces sp. NPDC060027 TaxID=3347040 RepID=UPI0036782E19
MVTSHESGPSDMSSKVVLITGTSSGIGLATAIAAARAGWQTVATLRDTERAGALRQAAADAGVELDIRKLDVTDELSVATAIENLVSDYGRLDAVVNNAGIGHLGTLENDSMASVREVMEVNYFGTLQVSKDALPHLRASKGRLITVTSVGAIIGQPFNEAYCAAKFAVEGYMESLAPVAAELGVTVSVVEPGAVATEFVNNVGVDLDDEVAKAGPYADVLRVWLKVLFGLLDEAQSPAEVADTVLTALTSERPPFRLLTSDWGQKTASIKLSDVDGSAVQALASGWLK